MGGRVGSGKGESGFGGVDFIFHQFCEAVRLIQCCGVMNR